MVRFRYGNERAEEHEQKKLTISTPRNDFKHCAHIGIKYVYSLKQFYKFHSYFSILQVLILIFKSKYFNKFFYSKKNKQE